MHIRSLLLSAVLGVSLATCVLAAPALTDEQATQIVNAGRKEPVEKILFKRSEAFPEVVAYGFFAHDRGYRLQEIIVESKSMRPKEAARAALALHGWDKADAKTREKLGKAWIKDILLGFSSPLEQPTSAFAKQKKKFEPITVTSKNDGSVTVRVWVQGSVGMRPILNYYREEFTFSPQGEIGPEKVIEDFEAPIN